MVDYGRYCWDCCHGEVGFHEELMPLELVKNPFGPDGWVCRFCEQHMRGKAYYCSQCKGTVCRNCQETWEQQCEEQSVSEQNCQHNQFNEEEEKRNIEQKQSWVMDSARSQNSELCAALAFGEIPIATAVPLDQQRELQHNHINYLEHQLQGERYNSARGPRRSPIAPATSPIVKSAREYGQLCQEFNESSNPKSPQIERSECLDCKRLEAELRSAKSLQSCMARFVDIVGNKATTESRPIVTKERCHEAWEEILRTRQSLVDGKDEQHMLDAMIDVTQWKLQSEREKRLRLERELDQTKRQLLKAMETITNLQQL